MSSIDPIPTDKLSSGGMPSEVFYFYAARAARGFGDGFAAIILPAYWTERGFDHSRSGSWRPLRCSAPRP